MISPAMNYISQGPGLPPSLPHSPLPPPHGSHITATTFVWSFTFYFSGGKGAEAVFNCRHSAQTPGRKRGYELLSIREV